MAQSASRSPPRASLKEASLAPTALDTAPRTCASVPCAAKNARTLPPDAFTALKREKVILLQKEAQFVCDKNLSEVVSDLSEGDHEWAGKGLLQRPELVSKAALVNRVRGNICQESLHGPRRQGSAPLTTPYLSPRGARVRGVGMRSRETPHRLSLLQA